MKQADPTGIKVVQSEATNSSNADWPRSPASRVVATYIHERVPAFPRWFPSSAVRTYVPGDRLRSETNAMT